MIKIMQLMQIGSIREKYYFYVLNTLGKGKSVGFFPANILHVHVYIFKALSAVKWK